MSLVGKLVGELEINAHAHEYYNIFKDKISHISKICPSIIQKIEVEDGDWDKHGHGSIKTWHYTVDGKAEIFKEQVDYDDKNLRVTMIGRGRCVFKRYKTFKATYQVVPKGPAHSSAILIVEYEKLDDNTPDPYKYIELMNIISKYIVSHLK